MQDVLPTLGQSNYLQTALLQSNEFAVIQIIHFHFTGVGRGLRHP